MSESIPSTSLSPLSDSELDLVSGASGGLIQYTEIVSLIALAAIAAITTVGTKVSNDITKINNKL